MKDERKIETVIAAKARIIVREAAKEFGLGPESIWNLERDLRLALGQETTKRKKRELNRELFSAAQTERPVEP